MGGAAAAGGGKAEEEEEEEEEGEEDSSGGEGAGGAGLDGDNDLIDAVEPTEVAIAAARAAAAAAEKGPTFSYFNKQKIAAASTLPTVALVAVDGALPTSAGKTAGTPADARPPPQ